MKFSIEEPLREWLEAEGLLEKFEANVKMFLRTKKHSEIKRPYKKLTEGFNFAYSFEGREYWGAVMVRAPKKIGGMA